MPCRYYSEEEEKKMLSDELTVLRAQAKAFQKELDLATKVACKVVKKLKSKKIRINDQEINAWVTAHDKQDKLRLKQEKE